MPFFQVRCKNPGCDAILPTPYFTSCTTESEIKSSMTGCGPIEIICSKCGHVCTYFRNDLKIASEVK
jgi:hypothetical protein